MRVYYDTEFIEDGKTVDLISLGMVAEDGRELYMISSEFSFSALWNHEWLMTNVAPHLPIKPASEGGPWDRNHPDFRYVHSREWIALQVVKFLRATPDVDLWAYFATTDFVALYQLFGRLVDRPQGVPMWTNDLQQECRRLGYPRLPIQAGDEHNALADARHNLLMGNVLRDFALERGRS